MNPQPYVRYQVSAIQGSGLGLIATSAIPRGTLIFSESPLFVLPSTSYRDRTAPGVVERLVNDLTEDEQQIFFSLDNRYVDQTLPAYGIFWSNFQLLYAPELGMDHMPDLIGLFLLCARLNHTCSPSACLSWNTASSRQVLYAIQDMQPGEQITIAYLGNLLQSRDVRQHALYRSYQFLCLCESCRMPDSSTSDARRLMLGRYRYESDAENEAPVVQFGYCKRAFELMRHEGLHGDIPFQVYIHALGICALQGDLARVSAFAVLTMDAMRACHGADAVILKKIRPFVRHPEKHWMVGPARPWRTRKQDTKRKDSPGFEEWLWSRAE